MHFCHKLTRLGFVVLLSLGAACNSNRAVKQEEREVALTPLEKGFISPPDSVQTSVYWYWISDNISKEGVVKDLQAMKQVGINRAFIGNIGLSDVPYGKVKILSEEWWDILHTALKTATALNIEIGIFNSPGWSQSGGPWVKPQQSMRYLAASEVLLKGPKKVKVSLEKPEADFQDVRVIAFKAPEQYGKTIAAAKPRITSAPAVAGLQKLTDGNQATEVALPAAQSLSVDFTTAKDFTARSIFIHPAHRKLRAQAEIQVKEGAGYRTLKSFEIDRSNDNRNVGFDPYGPVVVSLPETRAKSFRIVFSKATPDFALAEVVISPEPAVERYVEKTLAKMYQTPLPYWKEYQWPQQPAVSDKGLVIDPAQVVDISSFMTAEGVLNWTVPAGNWVVMRTGMAPTRVENSPASPEGTGLEIDKMSKAHVAAHFDAFLGEIIRRIPAADRKTWKVIVEDSYETGGQNWTDDLIAKFQANYGYDPLPYLPVMQGKVVGSPEQSDRFLWDLRRFIADRVAYDYVGGLRAVGHQHGLRTWLENYGHWGFPGEFLQYGGQSDEIGGEFWSEGDLGDIENRAASSAAHIYGKNKVSAESFTAGGKLYMRYPYLMKQRGDRFFTEGINNTLLHVFIHQPSDDKVPGVNAWFGNEFNRHNTWFDYMDLFTAYLKRSNLMLQQGRYVADVAYFIGEDAPKMTGVTDPELPHGYAFDYINAEVIQNRVSVKDGKMVLPDGMSYRLLVLPKLETMRPELLVKIRDLVRQGANILGPAPLRSPSLQHYPAADQQVKALARELWGEVNGTTVKMRRFGQGMVLAGMDMAAALKTLDIAPDFNTDGKTPALYIHRTTPEGEIYFVSNQSEKTITFSPAFRVSGKQPEYWDAVTGTMRLLPAYSQADETTTVPLTLEPLQSAFILFRKPAAQAASGAENFPPPQPVAQIESPWQVSFAGKRRGPAQPVTFDKLVDWTARPESEIKYYSGTALYRNAFETGKLQPGERLYLNLGEVKVMAKVRVNGKYVGGVWTAPWQVDITDAVKPGQNQVEISVVNTWVNRLIGDSKLPEAERKTWTSVNPYKPDSPLEPSGLKGPVTLTRISYGHQQLRDRAY